MGKLVMLIQALRYGFSLEDSVKRKNHQNMVNALTGLLGLLAVFLPIELPHEAQVSIAGAIVTIIGLYNIYTTTATTDKIGLPTKARNPAEELRNVEAEPNDEPVQRPTGFGGIDPGNRG